VGARGFEPRLPEGEHCSTDRRGQPYPPCTRKLAEGLGVEPSGAAAGACRVSSAVAYRPPRPLWQEARDSNSAVAGLESAALPIEPASHEIWQRMEESNPTGSSPVHRFQNGSAAIHRHPLYFKMLVLEERLELSRP
jgi:hypothetical protein